MLENITFGAGEALIARGRPVRTSREKFTLGVYFGGVPDFYFETDVPYRKSATLKLSQGALS
jgi:hypothetical protein